MSRGAEGLTGARAWAGSAVTLLAVLVGVWTLRPLLEPDTWFAPTAWVLVVVTAVVAVTRALTRSPAAPTAWGLGAAVLALAALHGDPGGPAVPLPTLETARTLSRVASAGAQAVADGWIPVAPTAGVTLLVTSGALAVLLLTDLLAVGLGRAGLAGLPLVALWAVPVVFERDPGPGLWGLGGSSFLLLLWLARPVRHRDRQDVTRDGLAATALATAVTLAALLAAPLAGGLPVWGSVRLPSTWGEGPGVGPVELSVDLDMRASLGRRSDRALITYTADGAPPGPLRLYTLTAFDGQEWQREGPAGDETTAEGVLWPDDGTVGDTTTTTMRVQVGELDQDHLPVPLEPREVRGTDATWRYDAVRDEVSSRSTTTRSLGYEVVVRARDLSADALRADGAQPVPVDSPYLALPVTSSAADTAALAREVTAGAASTYDQALALQSFFRDGAQFRYDTRVPPPRSDDAVWDFLTDRSGYCVQYATAMTVMARHLGIPARMGVGFLPGQASSADSSTFVVTGRRAHTWPELWFAGTGWVRFEPTPAAQTGPPPVYADPLAGRPVEPDRPLPSAAPSQPAATPTPGARPAQARDTAEVPFGPARVPLLLVLGLAAVLVVATVVGALTVGRRPPPRSTGPDASWTRLRARLEQVGVRWSDAATPRSAAAAIRAAGAGLDPDGAAALARLVAAVESERYAPQPGPWRDDELEQWVEAVVAAAARAVAVTDDGDRIGTPVRG